MTKIRFDNGITVTIRDGIVQAPSPTLTAFLVTLAATLPGYRSLQFEMDADYNIARGIIEKIGVGKIVTRRSLEIGIARYGSVVGKIVSMFGLCVQFSGKPTVIQPRAKTANIPSPCHSA
jgi:hypothetical protein